MLDIFPGFEFQKDQFENVDWQGTLLIQQLVATA